MAKCNSNNKKKRFYVVWSGVRPGVYDSWSECQLQVKGYGGALYRSFASREEAEAAYEAGPDAAPVPKVAASAPKAKGADCPLLGARVLAVDAACSGNPGMMEYRGVYLGDGREVFRFGPVWGTNNIGEFLAIVHGLALLERAGTEDVLVYSDSRTALSWVRRGQCRTTLARTARTEALFQLVERAERWLAEHAGCVGRVRKWETEQWGEIPADFGRK